MLDTPSGAQRQQTIFQEPQFSVGQGRKRMNLQVLLPAELQ